MARSERQIKRLEASQVEHKSTDKTVGKRCGICRFYRKIKGIETNLVGSCDMVKGVKKYGDSCNRFQLRDAAIPDWYRNGEQIRVETV